MTNWLGLGLGLGVSREKEDKGERIREVRLNVHDARKRREEKRREITNTY